MKGQILSKDQILCTREQNRYIYRNLHGILWTYMQEVDVAHFNVHEHYDDRTLENDICVVLLAAPLRSNQNLRKTIFSKIFSFLKGSTTWFCLSPCLSRTRCSYSTFELVICIVIDIDASG